MPCDSFAPGRALPSGECERCHFQRHEHLRQHQSLPNGKGLPVAVDSALPAPAISAHASPSVVFCRNCGVGLIVKPPHDPNTWPCPKCGHDGPKGGHPAIPMADEKADQRTAPALEPQLPPVFAAIKTEYERQAADNRPGYVDFDEVPESDNLSTAAAPPEGETEHADGPIG